MNYIIFDLEATCWENDRTKTNEIIEIGAIKISENRDVLGEFNAFVKPIVNPKLSEFCKKLTSITQTDVNEAHLFPQVISDFLRWINIKEDYLLCSWGHYDKHQLIQDSKVHSLSADWASKHISLKHKYRQIKNLSRPIGMKGALKMERMGLDGTHHRGIDDARNISKIFLKYFGKW